MENKMSKRLFSNMQIHLIIKIFLVFVFLFAAGIVTLINNYTDKSIIINEYNAEITINDSGDMRVVETWDMTYNSMLNVRFRDIDYNKFPDDYPLPINPDNYANFDVNSTSLTVFKDGVNVTDSINIGYSFNDDVDELGINVDCEPLREKCESLFVDLQNVGGLIGDITFVYDFTIKSAVSEYSDISEINWILFEYIEGTIKQGEVIINLPINTFDLSSFYLWNHGLKTSTVTIESNTSMKITFEDIQISDVLSFRLLAPTSVFPLIATNNIFIDDGINKEVILLFEQDIVDSEARGLFIENNAMTFTFGISLLMIFIGGLIYFVYFKPFRVEKNNEYSICDTPSNHNPAIIGYLYKMRKTTNEDFTATVLDLILREYLILVESNNEFELIIKLNQHKNIEELKEYEKLLVKWLIETIGDFDQVSTKKIVEFGQESIDSAKLFNSNRKSFEAMVKLDSEKLDFFDNKVKIHKIIGLFFALIPFVLVITGIIMSLVYSINIIVSIILMFGIFVLYSFSISILDRRSKKGQELFKEWEKYNRQLISSNDYQKSNVQDIDYWEKNLVYATSFGIAEGVLEQLQVNLPLTNGVSHDSRFLRVGYRENTNNYGFSIYNINNSYYNGGRLARITIAASVSSSSSSGGGGHSSGGGGGGGGRSR